MAASYNALIALAAISLFTFIFEVAFYFRIYKGNGSPIQVILSFLVFLYLVFAAASIHDRGDARDDLVFFRAQLLFLQLVCIGFIFSLGRHSYLNQRLFTISGIIISALFAVISLFLPNDLLFGQFLPNGNFAREYSLDSIMQPPGVSLWRMLVDISIGVFIISSEYMVFRKSHPRIRRYVWSVHVSIVIVLIAAVSDHLVDMGVLTVAHTLPYAIFMYLGVLVFVPFDMFVKESKKKENDLEDARQFIEYINHANVVIVLLNRLGHVTYINPYFTQLTGYRKEEVIGKDWFEFFLPTKDHYEVQSAFIEILEYDFHPRYKNAVVTKGGSEVMVHWNNVRLRDKEGKIIGSLSIGVEESNLEKISKGI